MIACALVAWLTTQGCTGQTFWVRKESGSFLYVNPNIDIGLYSSEFLFSLKNSNRAEPPACVTEYFDWALLSRAWSNHRCMRRVGDRRPPMASALS